VRDIATKGAGLLLWGDGDEEAAKITLAECLRNGMQVELVSMDADKMDEFTRELIDGKPASLHITSETMNMVSPPFPGEQETKALFDQFTSQHPLIAGRSETLSLTLRERDTVIAALRYWLREGLMSHGHEIELAENDHGKPLNPAEIDDLCERINCGE
jgi:hypothetical protein